MPIKEAISTQRVPVRIWTDDIDEGSKAQLANIASLPFIHHHVAAMPDVHLGISAMSAWRRREIDHGGLGCPGAAPTHARIRLLQPES